MNTQKYYFYGDFNSPVFYTMTVDVLRQEVDKTRDETGKIIGAFAATVIFMGVYTEAPDQETAEQNYRNDEDLLPAQEPACMLRARREFFAGIRGTHHAM